MYKASKSSDKINSMSEQNTAIASSNMRHARLGSTGLFPAPGGAMPVEPVPPVRRERNILECRTGCRKLRLQLRDDCVVA